MYRRIAEPLVVEASDLCGIKVLEVLHIRLATEEVQIPDLEVTEELAVVIFAAVAVPVNEPVEIRILMDILRVASHEFLGDLPETCERTGIV